MNNTICQNGVSSSQSSSHRHHGSMPHILTKQDELHGRCSSGSPNQPSAPYEPVSDHNAEKENERFQCRAVLLKLLQPPGSSVLHAQHNSCSLACQQTEKTSLKPDLCVSHCLRHAGNQQASRNSVDIAREENEEWTQKTRQCNENLSRKDSNRTSLPLTTVRCQSCEARVQPSYSEGLQSRTDRCQYFPEDRQQYFNGHACFRKDTCDTKRAPYITVQINPELQRKDEDSPQQMCPPTWRYKGCDSSMCQLSPSNQTLEKSHSEMGVTGASNRAILQNTERLPDHLRGPAESGKDSTYHIDERTHQDSPSSTQEKLDDHKLNSSSSYSMCSGETNRREPFCLSGEWSSPVVRITNGQRHHREERNVILEKTSESDNQTVPHSPNESSPVIENQNDECTPVIVQCYSLSTASPTLKPSSMSDSQFMNRQNHDESVHVRNVGVPTVPVSPSRSSYQQHSPRSLKPANRLQNNEDSAYDSPAPRPRNIANLHSHKFTTQPNHTIDESSTSEMGVEDDRNQTRSIMLPVRFHKSSAIPVGVPCLNCQPGHHASRRHHYLYNEPWTEPHAAQVHSSQSVSNQKTRCPPDLHVGHESGRAFTNWHTREVPNESKTALKIHDYYEERRILVGKVYQDIPDSVESFRCNRKSTSPYARMRQLYQDNRCQSPIESAEIFHAQASEESSTQICARQREIAVGSRKRKSRQPRPQRVNTNDFALARKQYQDPVQHAEGRQDVAFHNKFRHHASSPFQPDPSLSKEVHRKGRKDVDVCGNESEIYSFETVHEPTDQHESLTSRNDHVFESNSSTPKFCRSEIHSETYPPWRALFHDKRANKVPVVDRGEQFFVYPRGPVPPYAPVDRHHRANHGPHEYQMKSYCQTRTPHPYFAYSNGNVMEHSCNSSPDGNPTERHQHVPIWRRTPENHFATGSRYGSTQRSYSPRMLASYSGPSGRRMPSDVSATSHFERNSESSWNVREVPVHGEHRTNSLFYHSVPSKSKSPQHNSEEQSSLPSDQGCVSSTTVDDGADLHGKDDSDRPFQVVQASVTTDGTDGPTKEQENRDLFLNTEEVWTTHVTPTVKERKFVCRYCSKKFAHFSTLQNHLRTHTGDKPFQCKFCSRRFAQSGVLKAHLRTHTGDKPFACMYCGKVFAQSTTLTNHLRTHTGQKPYVCQFCAKSFSQPSTLRKHELSHTKERPYPCKFCGKSFAQQSTLTNHMRSHTGQRPYKCHFCDKSFAQLSTLDRHLRLHSSVSLKPYQCRHCSKSFSYFSNLSSHMQNHEREQGDT